MICQGGSSSRGSAGSNQHENNKNCLASCQSYAISQVCAPFGHVPSLSPSLAWPGLERELVQATVNAIGQTLIGLCCRLVSSTF